ncbi:MAG: hypothetical protein ACFE9X_11905 [Promethearchaeota archaeon]
MPKVLRDIWILAESGLTIFNRVIDSRVNPQIFGALMSAINTFAETLSEGGISNFELSNIRFTIVKQNHFLFVANSSNEVKAKKVLSELKTISKKFFNVYPEEVINSWNINIKVFADFRQHIVDSLEETN